MGKCPLQNWNGWEAPELKILCYLAAQKWFCFGFFYHTEVMLLTFGLMLHNNQCVLLILEH